MLVTVELADGGRGRLWLAPPGPTVGQPLEVVLRTYDDGTRQLGVRR